MSYKTNEQLKSFFESELEFQKDHLEDKQGQLAECLIRITDDNGSVHTDVDYCKFAAQIGLIETFIERYEYKIALLKKCLNASGTDVFVKITPEDLVKNFDIDKA